MIEKAGYIREDYKSDGYTSATTNKDIYKLLTNATGRYISEGIYNSSSIRLNEFTINGTKYGVVDGEVTRLSVNKNIYVRLNTISSK